MDAPAEITQAATLARLNELRSAYPGARLDTSFAHAAGMVVMKAAIDLGAHGSVSAHASVSEEEDEAVTRAELRAIWLALDLVPARPTAVTTRAENRPPARTPEPRPVAQPQPVSASNATAESDVALEDYSWTSFWQWARKLGFDGKGPLETELGRSIEGLNPAQVRDLLRERQAGK